MIEEKEVKILLKESEYEKLNSIFKWDKEFVQKNFYYGDSNFLNSEDKLATIRVREKNNILMLQVKIPILKNNSLHIKKEYEKEINYIPKCISKTELEELTGVKTFSDVFQIGVLSTSRKICSQYENIEICLDKNEYLCKTDYEIEIEYKSEYPENIINIIKQLNIDTSNDIDGKNTRFIKRMKLLNNCSKNIETDN